MRWYFAIDQAGGLSDTGEDAKAAVLSAAAWGQLEPRLLYHGAATAFTGWMQRHGVPIIETAPSFLPSLRAAEAAGTCHAHSIGHWLRVAVPAVEQEHDFVLYTDCDVVFLKPVNLAAIRPRILAAAPEFRKDNWNYFNAGVMVMNIEAMRVSYPAFEQLIISRMNDGEHINYDDEFALNEAYRGLWDRLDPALNWKPYWGFNAGAAILHFHGPKLRALEAIAAGDWARDNPTADQLARMADANLAAYIAWAAHLGDQLQRFHPARAARFATLAAALTRYQRTRPGTPIDERFMNFCMF